MNQTARHEWNALPVRDTRDVEAAAWIFEQIAVEGGAPADRSRIRRALEEAIAANPGPSDEKWWLWISELSHSLGQSCKILDCTVEQIVELAREGAQFVVRGEGEWLAVCGRSRGRFRVLQPLRDASGVWMRAPQLRGQLSAAPPPATIRCVVLQQHPLPRAAAEAGPSPLSRLWGLLQPEGPDLGIILVFAVVTGLLAMATPLAVEALVSTVAFGRFLQPIVILALMLLAFLSFSAALRALQTYVVEIIQRRLFARVAGDLAWRLPRVQAEALEGRSGRELVNRFFDVVTLQKVTAQFLLDAITLLLSVLIGMIVLAFYHPWLLGFDVVLLGLIALVLFVAGRGAVDTSLKESKCKYHVAAWLEDLAGCATAFRYDGAAEFALERTDRLIYEYLSARKKHFRILMRQVALALSLQAVASTVLLGLGGWLVISGQLTLGQLVAAELIVTIIVGAFAKMTKHIESFYDVLASVDKLGVLLDLPVERQDGLLSIPGAGPASVDCVGVRYAGGNGSAALDGVDLRLSGGECLFVSGPGGAGKSLFLDLLFGLKGPTEGHLSVNGVDPRDLRPDALRKCVALVRDAEAFEGSVAENVHLERTDVTTTDVREALERVGLLDDILRLDAGLDTPLASGGYPLTTSQVRRLMLARAIAGRPNLLLVDGTLDSFPDAEARRLAEMLAAPGRPWTLVLVTGRTQLFDLATHRLLLPSGAIQVMSAFDEELEATHAR